MHEVKITISDALVQDVCKQFIDLLFLEKTEVKIAQVIYDVIKSDLVAKQQFLSKHLTSNAVQIKTASLAYIVACVDSFDESDKDTICDAVLKTLGRENFSSVTNSSLFLAMLGLLNRFGRFTKVLTADD